MTRLTVVMALVLGLCAFVAGGETRRAEGCAFAVTPQTWEGPQSRGPYLAGEELAGHNRIKPNDTFFGTPNIEYGVRGSRHIAGYPYIPARLLKSIGYIESALAQAANSVPWSATGQALVSFDCGHGITQVTSGMGNPNDGGWPSGQQSLVATHYLYNIGRGAAILAEKSNYAPEARPIAGTDTDGDVTIVENWYFAVWSYNGFTGPGANRSNHPYSYSWPRTGFSCGPSGDGYGHSYSNYPYQEIIYGCMARPPSVSGVQLWPPLPASLPNLSDSRWGGPLSLNNWSACSGSSNCAAMDMPSPQPWHRDDTPVPSEGADEFLLANPRLSVNRTTVYAPQGTVTISNSGTGLLAWRARPGQSWVSVDKQAGVALDPNVPCASGNPCTRSPTLTIRRNDAGAAPGWVDIVSLTTGESRRVWIFRATIAAGQGDVSCDGSINSLDAVLILQYTAGVIGGLPCPGRADPNGDGRTDPGDAAIILQYAVGFVGIS